MTRKRIVVVGGGLSGLSAAATAARAGAEVVLIEARGEIGGRARTERRDGFLFNQGAHALYAGAAGAGVLAELGITPRGGRPSLRGHGMLRGRIAPMPGTPADLIRTRLIGPRAKVQLAKLLADPRKLIRTEMAGRSMAQWIEEQLSHADARAIVTTAARTATYLDDMSSIAAEVAVPQTVTALTDGVLYLDGGWQQLVDGLTSVAMAAGARIDSGSKVDSLDELPACDAVILAAGGPAQAARLLGGRSASVEEWAARAQPVYASGLDLGLARLPIPARRFCLAADLPMYFSVHTPAAALAPNGGELVHVLRYGISPTDPRAEMEDLLDQLQPGWRDEVRAEQYGKQWLVAHDRPTPQLGSLANRPGPSIPECDDVFVAGDWVGPQGMLADASLASGRQAAMLAIGSRPAAAPR